MVAILTPGIPAALDNPRWRAMMEHDTRQTGPFIVGTITTGHYCAPGCQHLRPLRLHAHFFDSVAEARLAGYRPCPHCCPADRLEEAIPA